MLQIIGFLVLGCLPFIAEGGLEPHPADEPIPDIPTWNGPYANLLEARDKKYLEQQLKQFMHKWGIPGMSLAISNEGRLAYANAFGFAEKNTERMTMRHVGRTAGGFSEPITSLAIYQLIQQVKLRPTDRVADKLNLPPELIVDQKLKDLQIIHLLQHTAGGWSDDQDPLLMDLKLNDSQLIEYAFRSIPLVFKPGEHVEYSNFGYFLLGKILEKVTSMSYESYVEENIFPRFLMCNGFIGGETLAERRPFEVKYYDAEDADRPYRVALRQAQAAYGWVTSPLDMLKFLIKLSNNYDDFPDGKLPLLFPFVVREMMYPSQADRLSASGWYVSLDNFFNYQIMPGFTSIIERISTRRQKTELAILMNSYNSSEYFIYSALDLRVIIYTAIRTWPSTSPTLLDDCNTLYEGNSTLLVTTRKPNGAFSSSSGLNWILIGGLIIFTGFYSMFHYRR